MRKTGQPKGGEEMIEITIGTEYDILTKKIISKFYKHNLSLYYINSAWVGVVISVGDIVLDENNNPIYIDRFIDASRKRDQEIMSDVSGVNALAEDIASELKPKVESAIVSALEAENEKDKYKYRYKINFACGVVRQGGYLFDDNDYYSIRFIYGFNLEREYNKERQEGDKN